ncbi:MFS transporter [Oceanicella actignis]|uniref:MFS transporter n=1 Tax=Oceanicella actignis TaxID=1189325 RepID=UPI001252560D|nr:MFS transporter [Oceanicella actignis]TYO85439.1 PPP family 3-phenylpropionic acid transporter [Oceanicella actignis]
MSARPRGGRAVLPAFRTGAFYAAVFAALGVHLPFWPLWLEDRGLSAAQIGVYSALAVAAKVAVGLAAPALADRFEARRAMLAGAGLFGAAAFAAHLLAAEAAALVALSVAAAATFSAMMPVGEALGAAAARDFGFDYARVRAVGSAGFLAASLLMGAAVAQAGPGAALWAIVACLLAAAALGRTHPGGGRARALGRPDLGQMRRLFSDGRFALFLLAIGMAQGAHGVIYAFGSLHWRALGLDEGRIGALWAFGVAAEIALMALAGRALVRRLGAAGAIALSGAAGAVRWAAMAFDPVGAALWALQGLHALTFAAGHLGAIAFVSAAAPERLAGAAQGALGALASGALMAAATALAAAIYGWAGGGVYWIPALMSAAGAAAALRLGRVWRGERIMD